MDTTGTLASPDSSTYQELALVLQRNPHGGGYTVEVYDGFPLAGHSPVEIETLPPLDALYLAQLQGQLPVLEPRPCQDTLEDIGDALAQWLLQGQIRTHFLQRVAAVSQQAGARLRVRLCWDPGLWELEVLLWEGLRVAEWVHHAPPRIRDAFVGLNPAISLVRHPLGATPRPLLTCPGRLKILLLYANPPPRTDAGARYAEYLPGARQAVLAALRPLEEAGWVEVCIPEAPAWGLTPAAAVDAIAQYDPHVLVILAHGIRGILSGGGFVLADGQGGQADWCGGDVAAAVQGRAVRVIFAPVCFSAAVVPKLAAAGVPALVGINAVTPFPDTHHVELVSTAFFSALAQRQPLEECMQRVREALSRNPGRARPEWLLPTLYLTVPNGRLFSSEEELWRVTYLHEYLLPNVQYFPATFDDRQKHLTVAEDYVDMKVEEEKPSEPRGSPADQRIPADQGVSDVPLNFSWMRVQEQVVQIVEKEVREALEQYRQLVVVSHAGGGKTTLVRRLVYEDVENAHRGSGPIPIMVSLKEWGGKQGLEAFLKTKVMHLHHAAKMGEWLGGRLRAKACRIYLDGLDEVSEERDQVIKALQDLAAQDVLIVVTSRMAGFDPRLEPAFHKVELRPFTDDQILKYAQAYWGPGGKAEEFVSLLETNPRAKALATNPLQLTFMVSLSEQGKLQLPASRDELYQQITAQLLTQRIGDRYTVHLQAVEDVAFHHLFCRQRAWRFDTGFLRERIEERLLEQFKAKWEKIAPVPPPEEIGKYLENLEPTVERIKQEVVASGLLTPLENNSFAFLHPSFHEYLAACGLQRQAKRDREVRRWLLEQGGLVCEICHKSLPPFNHYFWHAEWQEVIVLLAGVLGDTTSLLQRLRAEPDNIFHTMLSLAAYCLGSSKKAAQKVAGKIAEAVCQEWRTAEQEHYNTCTQLTAALEALGKGRQEQWAETVRAFLGTGLREKGVHKAAAQVLRKLTGLRVLPYLLEALKDEDGWIRWDAARTLRELKDRSTVPALLQILQDEDGWIRWKVVEALGELQDPQAVPGLLEVLKDEDRWVREAAIQALRKFKDPQLVPALAEALKDEDKDVRKAAVHALRDLKDPQLVPALAEALKDEDKDVRKAAVHALGALKDPQVIPYLVEALKDKDVSFNAVLALGKLKDFQVLPGLLIALRDKYKLVRRGAIQALSHFKDPRAIAALLTACKDEDKEVHEAAAKALRELKDPSAVPILHGALGDEEVYVRQVAVRALKEIKDPQVVPALVAALKDKDSSVCLIASKALEERNDPSSMPLLYGALKEKDEEWAVRAAVAVTLARIQSPEALAVLCAALKDEERDVRLAAGRVLLKLQESGSTTALYEALNGKCWYFWDLEKGEPSKVLGNIRDPEVIVTLYECLKKLKKREEHWGLRVAAARALGEVRDPHAVPALCDVLQDEQMAVRLAAVMALGEIGTPEAVPVLCNALTEQGWEIRRAAAEALGKIGAAESVPALCRAITDEVGEVRLAVVVALWKLQDSQAVSGLLEVLKEKAVPGLLEVLKEANGDWKDMPLCRAVVEMLGQLRDPRVLPGLLEVLKVQTWWFVRMDVVKALGQLRDPQAVPGLLEVLKEANGDSLLGRAAVEALGQLRDPRVLPGLLEVLKVQTRWSVRMDVVEALGQLRDPQAVPGLLEVLKEANGDSLLGKVAVVKALGELGDPQAVPGLLAILKEKHENEWLCQAAVEALGQLQDPRVLPGLLEVLKAQTSSSVRRVVVEALGELGDPQAVPGLLEVLDECCETGDQEVFDAAAMVLGKLKDPRAVPTLLKICAASEEGRISDAVFNALIELKDPRVLVALRVALRERELDAMWHRMAAWNERLMAGWNDESDYPVEEDLLYEKVRYEKVRQRLEEFDASSAIPVLVGALDDENVLFRHEAAEALGEIGVPQAVLPLLTAAKRWQDDRLWKALGTLSQKAKIRIYEDGRWTQLPPVEPSSVEAIPEGK